MICIFGPLRWVRLNVEREPMAALVFFSMAPFKGLGFRVHGLLQGSLICVNTFHADTQHPHPPPNTQRFPNTEGALQEMHNIGGVGVFHIRMKSVTLSCIDSLESLKDYSP